MKVLQLISSTGYYGAENVLVQLSNSINGMNGCTIVSGVIVNLQNPHTEIIAECNKYHLETAMFTSKKKIDLKTLLSIRRYILQNKINIIHSHGYKANLFAWISTFGLKTKLIATCHNWLGSEVKMILYAMLDKIILKRFNHVAAVSYEIYRKLRKSRISESRLSIVGNGVDLKRIKAKDSKISIKRKLIIPDTNLVIGSAGRISIEKGHVYLLNVAKDLLKEYSNLTFVIIGEGDLKKKLEAEFSDPNIIFTGLRNDMPDMYNCMDIFVLPSITEGLPMVVLEAMGCKIPIIASNVGYLQNVVLENSTGILIKPKDEKALKKALLLMIKNEEIRKSYGKNGYIRVKNEFSANKMANAYLKIYKKITLKD